MTQNEPIYKTEIDNRFTDTENRVVAIKGECVGGRDGLGVWD